MDGSTCSAPEAGDTGTCTDPSSNNGFFSFGLSPKVITFVVAPILALLPVFTLFVVPAIYGWFGSISGSFMRGKTTGRRGHIAQVINVDDLLKDGKKNVNKGMDRRAVHWMKMEENRKITILRR